MIITVTARMGSTRLPGKSMMDLHGKPMLQRVIERVQKSKLPIVVCTCLGKENDLIASLADYMNISFVRGPENDVMELLLMAAQMINSQNIVRVTGDNPLTDPDLINVLVENHIKNRNDYTYMSGPPKGTKSEVINVLALKELRDETESEDLRINMTSALQSMHKCQYVDCPEKWYNPILRLTVDYQDDMDRVRKIYDAFDGEPPPLDKIIEWCNANLSTD